MEENPQLPKTSFKIQPPAPEMAARIKPIGSLREENVPTIYYVIAVISIILVLMTLWVLLIEWAGLPLPSFLRIPVAS